MLFNYANVAVFVVITVLFTLALLLASRLIQPRTPSRAKSSIYECGEPAIGSAWINFNFRFYIIALVFIIFDVEIALMYPVAVVFKSWIVNEVGWLAFIEIFLFVLILLVGLIYVWVKGDLVWIKEIVKEEK
jgi:NADH-quinone oxidoreductase subunit A